MTTPTDTSTSIYSSPSPSPSPEPSKKVSPDETALIDNDSSNSSESETSKLAAFLKNGDTSIFQGSLLLGKKRPSLRRISGIRRSGSTSSNNSLTKEVPVNTESNFHDDDSNSNTNSEKTKQSDQNSKITKKSKNIILQLFRKVGKKKRKGKANDEEDLIIPTSIIRGPVVLSDTSSTISSNGSASSIHDIDIIDRTPTPLIETNMTAVSSQQPSIMIPAPVHSHHRHISLSPAYTNSTIQLAGLEKDLFDQLKKSTAGEIHPNKIKRLSVASTASSGILSPMAVAADGLPLDEEHTLNAEAGNAKSDNEKSKDVEAEDTEQDTEEDEEDDDDDDDTDSCWSIAFSDDVVRNTEHNSNILATSEDLERDLLRRKAQTPEKLAVSVNRDSGVAVSSNAGTSSDARNVQFNLKESQVHYPEGNDGLESEQEDENEDDVGEEENVTQPDITADSKIEVIEKYMAEANERDTESDTEEDNSDAPIIQKLSTTQSTSTDFAEEPSIHISEVDYEISDIESRTQLPSTPTTPTAPTPDDSDEEPLGAKLAREVSEHPSKFLKTYLSRPKVRHVQLQTSRPRLMNAAVQTSSSELQTNPIELLEKLATAEQQQKQDRETILDLRKQTRTLTMTIASLQAMLQTVTLERDQATNEKFRIQKTFDESRAKFDALSSEAYRRLVDLLGERKTLEKEVLYLRETMGQDGEGGSSSTLTSPISAVPSNVISSMTTPPASSPNSPPKPSVVEKKMEENIGDENEDEPKIVRPAKRKDSLTTPLNQPITQ